MLATKPSNICRKSTAQGHWLTLRRGSAHADSYESWDSQSRRARSFGFGFRGFGFRFHAAMAHRPTILAGVLPKAYKLCPWRHYSAIPSRAISSTTVFVVSGKQFSATTAANTSSKPSSPTARPDDVAHVNARANCSRHPRWVRPRSRQVENYQNNLQFIIEQLRPRRGRLTRRPAAAYEQGHSHHVPPAGEILGSIQNRHLGALVQAYLDDTKLMTISAAPPRHELPPRLHRGCSKYAQRDRSGRCSLQVLSGLNAIW